MSSIPTLQLLKEVTDSTNIILNSLQDEFAKAPIEQLRQAPGPNKWNALQCFDHLNMYGNFYLPEFEKAIQQAKSKGKTAKPNFSPGWLGNYATKSMLVDQESMQPKIKMNAFKNYTPNADYNRFTEKEITEMIRQQKVLLETFKEAEHISLDVRIPTTLSPFIKLKLGDMFRFLVAHNIRHFIQARRALRGA